MLQIKVLDERLERRKTPGANVAPEVSGFGFMASAGHTCGLRCQFGISKRGAYWAREWRSQLGRFSYLG